jgi:hypothetical protein
MNKIIKIIITIILIGSIFIIGYFMPFWRQKPIPPPPPIEDLKPLPSGSESYIKNGILYTSVKAIPLACITKMTRIDSMSVMIEYKFSNTHRGSLMMSYSEYKRLFEVNDAKT